MKQLLIKGLEKVLRLLAKDPETYVLGGSIIKTITTEELTSLPYMVKRAWVKEWSSALQLGCPYCDSVQINSTALDVMVNPPDYYKCEKCSQIMAVKQKGGE